MSVQDLEDFCNCSGQTRDLRITITKHKKTVVDHPDNNKQ